MADAPSIGTKTKNPLQPSFVATLPPGPFVGPVSDKLGKSKRLPLASKVTVTTMNRRSDSTMTISVATEVKSMTEGPVDASLFKLPAGYQKVELQTAALAPA